MSRSTSHPHVQTIIRALDRAAAHDLKDPKAGALRTSAAIIFEEGVSCDRFAMCNRERWAPENARAVVIAYAQLCPDDELESLASIAEGEIEAYDTGFYDDEEKDVDEMSGTDTAISVVPS